MHDAAFPPDLAGHFAALKAKDDSFQACNACLRGLIYTAICQLGGVVDNLKAGHPLRAQAMAVNASQALASIVKLDLAASLPESEDYDEDEWQLAMRSFFEARVDQFVNKETGRYMGHEDGDQCDDGLAGDRA